MDNWTDQYDDKHNSPESWHHHQLRGGYGDEKFTLKERLWDWIKLIFFVFSRR